MLLIIFIVIVIIAYKLATNDQMNTTTSGRSRGVVAMNPDHTSVYYAKMLIRIGVGLLRGERTYDIYIGLSAKSCWFSIESFWLSEAVKGNIRWNDPQMLKMASSSDWNDFKNLQELRVEYEDEVRGYQHYYAPNASKWYQYVCEYIRDNYPNEKRIHIDGAKMEIRIKNF